MITGSHVIIYSNNPAADRIFLRDVLKLSHVDAGEGWLIFGLPPSELAFHFGEENGRHELYLLSDDIRKFIARMTGRGVRCGDVQERDWGLLTEITLPGGGHLGVYEPRHPRPPSRQRRVSNAARSTKRARTPAGRRKKSGTRKRGKQ